MKAMAGAALNRLKAAVKPKKNRALKQIHLSVCVSWRFWTP